MELKDRDRVLAKKIGPTLAMDGTHLEVLEVAGGIAHIPLGGACRGCPVPLWP